MAGISILDYLIGKGHFSPEYGKGGVYQDRLTRVPGIDYEPNETALGETYGNDWSKNALLSALMPISRTLEARQIAKTLPEQSSFIVARPEDKGTYNHEIAHALYNEALQKLPKNDRALIIQQIIQNQSPRTARMLNEYYGNLDARDEASETLAHGLEFGEDRLMSEVIKFLQTRSQNEIASKLGRVYERTPRR